MIGTYHHQITVLVTKIPTHRNFLRNNSKFIKFILSTMNKVFLPLTLPAAAVRGATEYQADSNIHPDSSIGRRSLTQSILHSLFRARPKVNRCWGEMETDDVTGERRPTITCEFFAPKDYNSTSDIKLGTCREIDEPSCTEKVNDDCIGPFITSGKMRTVAYPVIHPDELYEEEFNHTYCARVDVYQVDDTSGEQTSIAHATRELVITFTGDADNNLVEELEPELSTVNPTAVAIGSMVGILIVIPIVAFFLMKRKRGGVKIHESTNTEGGANDERVKDERDIEIV